MGHRTRVVGSVAAALLGLSLAASGEEAKRPTLAVLAYNYAAVPADTMQQASEKVAQILRDVGVEIVWIEPLADSRRTTINPSSNVLQMFTVQLLIRQTNVSRRSSTPESVMGSALAADDHGGTVSLFYDEVLRTRRQYSQPLRDILALAIAHEIGHVLLPFPAHSPTGVMRSAWNGDDIRHAIVGSLGFTTAQGASIRLRVDGCCREGAK